MIEKCPVCNGKGIVPIGFYNPQTWGDANLGEPEKCRSCSGKGVIKDD